MQNKEVSKGSGNHLWKKGQSGNPAGKKPGTKSLVNTNVINAIQQIVEKNLPTLQDDLDRMGPSSKWRTLEGLMKYAYATYSQQKLEGDINQNIEIKVSFTPINNLAMELEAPEPKSIEDSTSIDFVDLQKDMVTGFTTKSVEKLADQQEKEDTELG